MIGPAGFMASPKADSTQEPRPMLQRQTIIYYVLAALERVESQPHGIRNMLRPYGHDLTAKQISGALQRLRKEGLAEYKGKLWQRRYGTLNPASTDSEVPALLDKRSAQ